MGKTAQLQTVNIRPGVSILSVLRHLNYRPWYALAEFVDNALQSYLDHRAEIEAVDGVDAKLRVEIQFDPTDGGRVVVRDNAAGIHHSEYARAFRPAAVPPDQTGLCEFGMGMKSAACWFAAEWSARTCAIGEGVERTVRFDINKIVRDSVDELKITTRAARPAAHYTEIVLGGLNHRLQGRTLGKIKDHLASIYRVFIRQGILDLIFDTREGSDTLKYHEPAVLRAPSYHAPTQPPVEWRKDIVFDLGRGLKVTGFAALRATASTSLAGFALFRRDRLIQGSADETYRPEIIFGKTNSYRYQRLFGELHLEGFEVSHTKDGFRWDDQEEPFLDLLKEHLNAAPLPLLDQAEGYRVRAGRAELVRGAKRVTDRTADVIERDVPPVLEHQIGEPPDHMPPPRELPPSQVRASAREIDVELGGHLWRILIETTLDPAIGEWVTFSDKPDATDAKTRRKIRQIAMRMSLAHPFMERFCGADENTMEALLRVAAAIGLAQTAARDVGVKMIGTVIRNMNDLLRNGLSNP